MLDAARLTTVLQNVLNAKLLKRETLKAGEPVFIVGIKPKYTKVCSMMEKLAEEANLKPVSGLFPYRDAEHATFYFRHPKNKTAKVDVAIHLAGTRKMPLVEVTILK